MSYAVTIMLVITVTIAALALHAETQAQRVCADDATRERIRGILLSGLDDALRAHVKVMYDGMLRDVVNQPERARRGMDEAAAVYLRTRGNIESWGPPPC